MSKATKAHSASRRQFLAAAPAALVAGSVPAVARTADVSPVLLVMVEKLRAMQAKRIQLEADYAMCPAVPESGLVEAGRACDEMMDAEMEAEAEIMAFPARTLGEVIILARLGWSQMTADPDLPDPFDDFVRFFVPAVLRLDGETDQTAIDKWLSDLRGEEA